MIKWKDEIPFDSQTPAARFRHSGWAQIRKRVFDAMQACHVPLNRRNAFATCGNAATVCQNDAPPHDYKIRANHCHDRLCTPCANARSQEIARALNERLHGSKLSFITLTICGTGQPLAELLRRLYVGFRALRLHPAWKDAVRGGAAFLEVKWSDRAQRWHPHFHLICDASFIDQGELSTIWRTITKDSFIVDVRRVQDPEKANRYVTKYASKPLNSSFSNNPSLLQEALTSLHGKRLCFCFGTWYKIPLHDVDVDDQERGSWTPLYSLNDLLREAERGNLDARCVLEQLHLIDKYRKYLLSDSS